MTKLRIIAAVVDTKQLTMYKDDGTTYIIPQGDPALKPIVEYITPIITAKQVAEFDTADYIPKEANVYKDFEEKSSGGMKFFRVLKSAVAHIFKRDKDGTPVKAETVAPQTIGSLEPETVPVAAVSAETAKITSAVDEIIAQAKPVSDADYQQHETTEEHTIIAKVGNTIIPGVDKMKIQFAHAAKMGSTKGVEAFFKRLEPVMKNRKHSVEDLLNFMEKGDLPIADDGSIIAYKKLYKREGKNGLHYVDPHTKKVIQQVGSYVMVDEKLVDPDRYNECSNGLHIGRRGYMGGFSGDTIMLCKIPPENVIAVPHRDPNKVRVCGYHILFKLSDGEFANINSNKPMTEHTEGRKMLAKAISGDHIGRIEEVRITGQSGNGLVITPLETDRNKAPKLRENAPEAEAIDITEHDIKKANPVDPKKVAQSVTDIKTDAAKTPRQLFDEGRYDDLIALRKKRKVGWAKLGFTDGEVSQITTRTVIAEPSEITIKQAALLQESKEQLEELTKFEPLVSGDGINLSVIDSDLNPTSLINSIKNYRQRTRQGLKESKDAVEPIWNERFPRLVQSEAPQPVDATKISSTFEPNQKAEPAPSTYIDPLLMSDKAYLIQKLMDAETEDNAYAVAERLYTMKKKAKVSWTKFGLAENEAQTVENAMNGKFDLVVLKKEEPPVTEVEEKPAAKAGNTPREMFDRREWSALWTMKKKAKKGWETYGFTAKEIERLKTNKPDFI